MLRKVLFASLTAVGLMAATPTNEAQADVNVRFGFRSGGFSGGFVSGYRSGMPAAPAIPVLRGGYSPINVAPLPIAHGAHYHVMYRHCSNDPWRTYGTYGCHEQAHQVEHMLEARGYQAKVVHH